MVAVISIQARMGSDRLPGKVLAPVMGRPLLAYQIERLQRSRHAQLVICTTPLAADDAIADLATSMGVACVRGSETDLMSRHLTAALYAGADLVGIQGADDPLLEASTFDALFEAMVGPVRYAKTLDWPVGTGAYVVRADDLGAAFMEAYDPVDRAEVVSWWDRRPGRFPTVTLPPSENIRRPYRLTVDYPEDMELVSHLFRALYPANHDFTLADVCAFMDANPDLHALNGAIEQPWWSLEPVG